MTTFAQIKFYILLASFLSTILTNTILIFLIITKSPPKLGNYKHLMCYFSVLSIIFATFELLVQPYVYSDASFVIVMNIKDTIFEEHPNISLLMLACVSACFQISVYSIAINFIFRYFAIQREGRLRYFAGKLLYAWMIFPILIGMIGMIVIFCMGPNDYVTNYLRFNLKEVYDIDIDYAVYSGCLYWKTDELGIARFNFKYVTGIMILNLLITIPLIIIILCGWKIYKKIKDLVNHGESEYSRRLQTQLYKALVAQTLIPLVFLFFPVLVYAICPLIGCSVESGSLSFIFLYAFYPALDPIPIIFMIDDYSIPFLNFFRRVLLKNEIASVTSYETNLDHF